MGTTEQTSVKLTSVPVEGLTGTETKRPKSDPSKPASIHSQNLEHHIKLPRGLVGNKCTANIKVSGVECNCLLDTGSQVTTVSTSFYNNHLSEHPIQPVDGLDVEGASGATVPYLGYIPLVLKFPKEFVETEPEVATLALVVPDTTRYCSNRYKRP